MVGRTQRRARGGNNILRVAGFGQSVVIDHAIVAVGGGSKGVGENGERVAPCIKELGTGFVDMIPLHDRLASATHQALDYFYGDDPRLHIYSDGAR